MADAVVGLSLEIHDKGTEKLKEALKLLKDIENQAGKKGQLPVAPKPSGSGRAIPSGASSEASAIRGAAKAGASKLASLSGGEEKYKALIADLGRGEEFIIESGLKPLKKLVKTLETEAKALDKKEGPGAGDALRKISSRAGKAIQDYEVRAGDQLSARMQQTQLNAQASLSKLRASTDKAGIAAGSDSEAVFKLIDGVSSRNTNLAAAFTNSIQSFTESGGNAISTANFTKDLSTLGTQASNILKAETGKSDAALKGIFENNAKTVAERIAAARVAAFGDAGKLNVNDVFGVANQSAFAKYAGKAATTELKSMGKVESLSGRTTGLRDASPDEINQKLQLIEKETADRIKAINTFVSKTASDLRATGSAAAGAEADKLVAERDNLLKAINASLEKKRADLKDAATKAATKSTTKAPVDDADKAAKNAAKASQQANAAFSKSMGMIQQSAQNFVRSSQMSLKEFKASDYTDLSNRVTIAASEMMAGLSAQLKTGVQGANGKEVLPFQGKLQNNFAGNLLAQSGFNEASDAGGKLRAIAAAGAKLGPALQAAGLTTEEYNVANKQISAAFASLTKMYGVLIHGTDKLNTATTEDLRSQAQLLISEKKYDEALNKVRETILKRAAVPEGGKIGTKQRGKALKGGEEDVKGAGAMTPEQLAAAGVGPNAISSLQNTSNGITQRANNAQQAPGQAPQTNWERFRGFASKVGAVAGVFNVVTGAINSAVNEISQLIDKAGKLEKASATVSALAGSTSNYTKVLGLAAQQQQRFGGTLEEQLQGFVSLVPVTKRYGVDLQEVDNIARRLAIVDPLQGFSGAAIALKEFFAGDITSLSRRFEIDRKTLNSIKEAGSKAEQLKKLDEVLNNLGISQQVLAARTATTAAQFDKAGSAWDNYQTLLGQGAQELFLPLAQLTNDYFGDSANKLAQNLSMSEKKTQIQGDFGSVATKAANISVEFTEINKPVGMFDQLLGRASGSMTQVVYGARNLKGEMQDVLFSTNSAIDEMNKLRIANGQNADYVGFGTDAAKATMYARANQFLNPADVMQMRQQTMFYDPNAKGFDYATAGARLLNPFDWGNVGGHEITQMSGNFWDRIKSNTDVAPELAAKGNVSWGDAQLLAKLGEQTTRQLTDPAFAGKAKTAVRELKGIVPEKDLKGLSDAEKLTKILLKTLNDAQNGYISAGVAAERFYTVLSAEEAKPAISPIDEEIKRLEKAKEEYDAAQAKIGDSSFATDLYNNSLKETNGFTKEINDSLTKTIALQYYQNTAQGTLNGTMDASIMRASELFEIEGDTVVERETAAKVIAEATILQTRLVLEQERSVSVIGAMGDNFGKYVGDLEKAAQLAVEFKNSMASIVTGPLMAGMSIQDQLSFTQLQMAGGVPGMDPTNQNAVTQLINSELSLVTQAEQEKIDAAERGAKSAADVADMNKEFLNQQKKDRDKHDKDMLELQEQHNKKMEELQRESEISKRSNELGFYESLYGMDNLTADQMAAADAEYQAIKAEATTLRNQGEFEKAAAVETAGKEGILSKYGELEKKAQFTKDIEDSNERLGELQKKLGEAKTADDRAEIQREIDKEVAKKAGYENEIKQIDSLETIRKNLYEAALTNARTLQETETENYKKEVGKRNKDFEDAEKEKTLKHDEEVAKRKKVADEAHKAQISNMTEQIALMAYGNSFIDEAYARTLSGAERRAALEEVYADRAEAENIIMSSTSLAAPTLQRGLKKYKELGPNMMQDTLSKLTMPGVGDETLLVQKDLATKTGQLKQSMDAFTAAVIEGKIIIVRQK